MRTFNPGFTPRSALRRAALATTSFAALVATPALAQAEAADDYDVGAIVVTARRVEERLQDVPISITVFNQEQLSQRNITNSTELAAYTPSLAVNSRYGSDKSSFALRGFSQDLNTLPTVGVYFADVVAPRLTSNITSGNGAGVGSMFDLQNVQVLKGPQGTLFGRNTTGGAILLVPRKPTDRLEGYVEGTIGNYDARRVEAVLNVPLSDTFRVRIGVDRNKRDGWLRNRSGIGPRRFNDSDYFAARLSLVGDLTPDLENYLIATYAESESNGTVGKMAFCNRGTTGTGGTSVVRTLVCGQVDREAASGYGWYDISNSHPDPFVKSHTFQIINTTTWRASDTLTIKNIASYGEAHERYAFNLSGDFIAFPFVHTYPGSKGQGNQWTFTEELQFQGNTTDGRLNWQAGGYMEISDPVGGARGQEQWTSVFANCTNVYAFQCSPLTLNLPTGPRVIGNVNIARNVYWYRNYGVYAQATYRLTDQLSITAGARNTWDRQREIADNVQVVPSPAGPVSYRCSRAPTPVPNPGAAVLAGNLCTQVFRTRSSEPTWMIDIDYKPTDDMMIYAKWSRGYRGGGINEANAGAETWKPEFIDAYEVGLKAGFRGAVSGNFNFAAFWNDFRDQQASVFIPQCTTNIPGCTNPAPTGINGIQNIGKSRLRGIEAEGSLTVFDSLRLDFGYAYLDAEVRGGSVPTCDNTRFICSQASFLAKGTRLPFAPRHRVTLSANYTLPLDESIGEVSFGGTFVHTSKQFTGHGDDAAFAAGLIPFNASLNPALDLLNLNASWKGIGGLPVDLSAFATNVTKKKYYVSNTNGLSTLGGDALILGAPRMYGLRLKFRFGE